MELNSNYLPRADVVFTVMFLNKELCEKTLKIILGEEIELANVQVESKNDLHMAALNSVYFDVRTLAKDGRIITLDLQRKYMKDRVRNRTIYYACREIGFQPVVKHKYEKLKNVIITFLLTEAPMIHTTDNRKIQLHDNKTGEIYSELLTIHEVNIKHITEQNSVEMQILRDFFQIENQESFDKFVDAYSNTEYGYLLLKNYVSSVSDAKFLSDLGKETKYTDMLSQEERIELLSEGREEQAIETAKILLSENVPLNIIIKSTGLTKEKIEQLK